MYLHHGLVSTQGQQHAGPQLVFSQRQEELLGLVAGAHQDVNLEEKKSRGRSLILTITILCVRVCVSVRAPLPYWQTTLHHRRTPRLRDCRAETSRLYLNAH